MHLLFHQEHEIKSADRSADLTKALKDKSSTFAAEAARFAFGKNYPAEGHDGFVDRRPGELSILRAAGWLGSNR